MLSNLLLPSKQSLCPTFMWGSPLAKPMIADVNSFRSNTREKTMVQVNIKKRFRFISIQCVFFYWVKGICSFDPLKIASDWSNIYQILCLVKTFDKNTP